MKVWELSLHSWKTNLVYTFSTVATGLAIFIVFKPLGIGWIAGSLISWWGVELLKRLKGKQ